MARLLMFLASLWLAAFAMRADASPADDPDTEIARRHFERGAVLYDQSRYTEAVSELMAARRVKSMPALEYNIARCYDRLENAPAAIDYYERYLASNPPTATDGGARERLRVLRARLGGAYESRPSVAVSPPPAAASPLPRRYSVVIPAAVGGLAIAALITGGALYGVSGSRYADLTAQGCGTTHVCDGSVYGGTRSMERAGITLLVTGGVLAVVDTGLWAAWGVRPK